jgi:Family of unknown function (DUF6368)
MAGPTLQLRAKCFGKPEKQKIKTLLTRISNLEEIETYKFEFNFKKGKTLGLFLKENSCLFLMDFSLKTDENDELQKHDFETKIKDKPEGFINISAMCNDALDHQLLANFALEINKIVGGFIDLNGAIIHDAVNSIKGQIHEIHYKIDDEQSYYYHIVDVVWLHNWTLHKDFRLIK